MPKRVKTETLEQQAKRFVVEVERLIEAGELSAIEADAALDKIVRKAAEKPR